MTQEVDPTLLEQALSTLKYLLPTSIAGLIALYTAWVALPPELRLEGTADKSKKFNTKSRLVVKNSGKIPAHNVKADVENLCAEINTNTFKDCGFFDGPNVIGKLSGGETSEISISPGFHVEGDMGFDAFSYILTLKYHANILGLKKQMSRKWKVELNNFADGYSWNITIL